SGTFPGSGPARHETGLRPPAPAISHGIRIRPNRDRRPGRRTARGGSAAGYDVIVTGGADAADADRLGRAHPQPFGPGAWSRFGRAISPSPYGLGSDRLPSTTAPTQPPAAGVVACWSATKIGTG